MPQLTLRFPFPPHPPSPLSLPSSTFTLDWETRLTKRSTFALSFWYALKLHINLELNSAETLIV